MKRIGWIFGVLLFFLAACSLAAATPEEPIDHDQVAQDFKEAVESLIPPYNPPEGYVYVGTLLPGESCTTNRHVVTNDSGPVDEFTDNPNVVVIQGNYKTEEMDTYVFVEYAEDHRFDVYAPQGKTCKWSNPESPKRTPFSGIDAVATKIAPTERSMLPTPMLTPSAVCTGTDPFAVDGRWKEYSYSRSPKENERYVWVNPNGLGSVTDEGICIPNGADVVYLGPNTIRYDGTAYDMVNGSPYLLDAKRVNGECSDRPYVGLSYPWFMDGDGNKAVPYYDLDGKQIWKFNAGEFHKLVTTDEKGFIVDVNGQDVRLDPDAFCRQ